MADVSVGAAQAFIEGEFGGPTEESDELVTATTSEQKIVDNDPEALALTLINLGSNTVYAFYDDTVSTSKGIILNANGGYVSFTVRDDQTLPTRQWWVLTNAGTSIVLAIRTRRYALTYQPTRDQLKAILAAEQT